MAGEAGQASSELSDGGANQGGPGTDASAGEGGATASFGGQGGGGQPPIECEPACETTEECVDGVCECPHELCDGVCTDTQQDAFNCGQCGNYCGNGDCVEGRCACPGPLVDCSTNDTLICRDVESDESACGDCGVTCQAGGLCVEGSCDMSVEWVRIYGTTTTDGRPAINGRLVADAQGNLFAAIGLSPGPYSELPGATSLFAGGTAIIKFNAEGAFQWAKPSDTTISGLAVMGSDVWALTYSTTVTSIADQLFNLAAVHDAMTIAVELSGETGLPIDFFQLDNETRSDYANPRLLSNGTELWVVNTGGSFKLDDTSWQPPSLDYGAYLYPRGGEPVWLPGTKLLGVVHQGGDVVVLTDLAKNQSVSFGGDTLTTGAQGARGIARYSSSLAHESSFLIDWHWLSDGVFTASDSSYFILSLPQKPFFQQYDPSGMLLELGGTSPPFDAVFAKVQQGRVFAAGYVLVNGGTVGEREFTASAALLATFDETTQELEHAMTFEPQLPTDLDGPAGILDAVVSSDGSSAVLLTSFKRGLLFRDREYDFGADSVGFALVKVRLN